MNPVTERTDIASVVQFHDEQICIVLKIRRGFFMFLIWSVLTFAPVLTRVPVQRPQSTDLVENGQLPPKRRPRTAGRQCPLRQKPDCSRRRQ